MIVLLFACFPAAFAAITTALHVPLAVMLVGIVLRGSAFIFRSFDPADAASEHRWSLIFAVASTVTPVMLGVVAGAVSSGRLALDPSTGRVPPEFLTPWLASYPLAVGAFALVLFAYLAATYLAVEADDAALAEDFRRRALWSAAACAACALATAAAAAHGAPHLFAGLTGRPWSAPVIGAATVCAVFAAVALVQRHYARARALAAAQVALIVVGWALAQRPHVVAPDLTFANAAAPASVLRPVLVALAVGLVVLVPSFVYLFRVFKTGSVR